MPARRFPRMCQHATSTARVTTSSDQPPVWPPTEEQLSLARVYQVGALVEQGVRSVGIAQRHGVTITYGSDLLAGMRSRQLEGFGLLIDGGLSAADALRTATCNAAELVGLEAGAIAPGLHCDVTLLRCNPLDAANLRALNEADVLRVWVGGKPLDA